MGEDCDDQPSMQGGPDLTADQALTRRSSRRTVGRGLRFVHEASGASRSAASLPNLMVGADLTVWFGIGCSCRLLSQRTHVLILWR
jgi:hypothetical protein